MKFWQAGILAVCMWAFIVLVNLALLAGAVWFVVWLLRQLQVIA